MKTIRRLLAILLVVAMVASFSSAFALEKYQYTKYRQYLCIGDSVAAGYTYSGSWDNYGFTRVRGAYHDIVANAVDADLLQYATSGFRLIELRYMMDKVHTDPDDFWKNAFGKQYMSPEVLDEYTDMFRDGIKTSDLMSVNLGSNDVLTASALKFIAAMNNTGTTEESKNALVKQVQDYLAKLADQNNSFADLLKLARTAREMPGVLRELINNIFSLYNLYKENWEATMKVIYTELNPDITLEVLGVYNPAYKIFIDENRTVNLGPIVQPVIDMLNRFMRSESSYAKNYTFVDVDGVDSWGMTMADPNYFTYFVWSMHPTRLGHTDIAKRMLEVLPEHWVDIEFTKQPQDVTAKEGETASFSVETRFGNTPYFQWQTAPKGSTEWTDIPTAEKDDDGNAVAGSNPTAATANLTVTAEKALDGQQYRCVVTDFYGQRAPITSDAATLTVTDDQGTDPADDPATDPADDPGTDPADDPATDPADDPDTDPADDPSTDPADDPATDPADDQGKDPADDQGKDPADDQGKDDQDVTLPFTDVKKGDWSYDEIAYAYENGLMQGKSKTIFDPKGTTTRAEFATVIYHMAGNPEVTDEMRAACKFTDLVQDWYKDPVAWAFDAGVVKGTSDTTFSPSNKITREQMVAMLYRYTKADEQGDLSKITDAASITDYAKPAVAWAVKNGVVTGMPDGSFQPQGNATREQMAAIMARFDKLGK